MYLIPIIVGTIAFAVLAPVVGCLLAGLDRKLSARMQGRVGPPILQPYYDVRKLLEKDRAAVNNVEGIYITCALVFAILAGGIFFGGGNLLDLLGTQAAEQDNEHHGRKQSGNPEICLADALGAHAEHVEDVGFDQERGQNG